MSYGIWSTSGHPIEDVYETHFYMWSVFLKFCLSTGWSKTATSSKHKLFLKSLLFCPVFYSSPLFPFSFFLDWVQIWPFLRYVHGFITISITWALSSRMILNLILKETSSNFLKLYNWYAYYIFPNKDFYHLISFSWGEQKSDRAPWKKKFKSLSWKISNIQE